MAADTGKLALTNAKSVWATADLIESSKSSSEVIRLDSCNLRLAKLAPKREVTGLDRALRDIMERKGDDYNIFMGTLDAMNDNLIAEALSRGVSVDKITHAMFACEESRHFLHRILFERLGLGDVEAKIVLDVLHLGIPVEYDNFAKPLVASLFGRIDFESTQVCGALDLSTYTEVPVAFVENEGKMEFYCHLHGIYRIVMKRITLAMVPHGQGVRYFVRNTPGNDFSIRDGCNVRREGQGPHLVHETANTLVKFGCEGALAWSLLAKVVPSVYAVNRTFLGMIVRSFQVVSAFRTELYAVVKDATINALGKKLTGTRNELFKLKRQILGDKRFDVTSNLYKNAKNSLTFRLDQSALTGPDPLAEGLEPFNTSFLSIDNLETYMELLGMLISEAQSSDINSRKKEQGRSRFNARTVAILGALNGKEVKGSLLPAHVRTQYFYQDDDDTKCLCTPFSNLILFATTKGLDDANVRQVQSIKNWNDTLNNWIALRAALELDMLSFEFRRESKQFQLANELVSVSIARFIDDTNRRFSEFFDESPDRVRVSQLTKLERTGASSAWLVREFISRYIAKGAKLECSGDESSSSYGRMEQKTMEIEMRKVNRKLPMSAKVLEFDCKVNIEGFVCSIYYANFERKVVVLLENPLNEDVPSVLNFKDGRQAPNHESAKEWLEQGQCANVEVVPEKQFIDCYRFLFAPPTVVVLGEIFV